MTFLSHFGGVTDVSQIVVIAFETDISESELKIKMPLLAQILDFQPLTLLEIMKVHAAIESPIDMDALAFLSQYADGVEKQQLELFGTDQAAYLEAISQGLVWIDLMEKFPSLRGSVSLETILKHMPVQHPRSYSVSSSRGLLGKSTVQLCVGRYLFSGGGINRVGVCSNFLSLAPPGTPVRILFETNRDFHLPSKATAPIFLVCAGTGVAPMRGLVQERMAYANRGLSLGPAMLLVGFRSKREALFVDEFNRARACGALSSVLYVFSREGVKKERVNTCIRDNMFARALLKKILNDDEAHAYICGSADMATEVIEAIKTVFGPKVVSDMISSGRVHQV